MRYKFNMCTWNSNETVADYVADLKHLSERCIYRPSLEDMLWDHLLVGINNENIQQKLLPEPSLSFKKAFF